MIATVAVLAAAAPPHSNSGNDGDHAPLWVTICVLVVLLGLTAARWIRRRR